jgi:hypothetical protein
VKASNSSGLSPFPESTRQLPDSLRQQSGRPGTTAFFPKIFADRFPAQRDRKNPPRRAPRHEWLAKAAVRAI